MEPAGGAPGTAAPQLGQDKDQSVRTRLAIKIHAFLERRFPERRVFLKSDSDTRFIRLRSETQLIAFAGMALLVAWSIVATAIVLMDSIGSGNFREQAKRDQMTYRARLNALSSERDDRAAEALAAQERFNAALTQISSMQSELLASETRRRELETGIEVIQTTLRQTMKDRETARDALAALKQETAADSPAQMMAVSAPVQMEFMADALAETAAQRDQIEANAQSALEQRDALELELRLLDERNDQIFRQLEEAMEVSVAPLDKMFRSAGMPTDRILEQVRRGYSGQGGPLSPLALSTRGEEPTREELRANDLLRQMNKLNLYRLAAQKAPFASPVNMNLVRRSSGFGYRRDPKTGGRRLHKGSDFAGRTGTDIFATADGVVTHAGWQSGYGKLVTIQHAFGIETKYAHNSKLRVKVGQRVSRGDHIADMGNTGRSTGTHLHYEVRVNGNPVNPMIYIKAARNVF
ncbi:putative peptidase M23 family protein [Phaeobacter piscinae]|uniref:Peptidase M23 family protein n=2 Tax=Phaeobacter piscinae TaxID=1580596 RepID=A0ABM6PDQ2_9RHOB|nr:putative peptidase M23 family protein [Phaeobacter piscinae]ATG39744.1 putative peptidase M23 family protein [Phaeobacter piscinae]AUQ86330.1 putative peptidase M23 family protein [Phaeobacter piscinae]AUR24213.1 putative peptidase M23 family protein [Phaeobacter piscinae]